MSRPVYTFARDAYAAGNMLKTSRFSASVGFVFSKAEMDRLAELRKSMDGVKTGMVKAGAMVGGGLGALALAVAVASLGRKVGSRR
jgi:galactokinase